MSAPKKIRLPNGLPVYSLSRKDTQMVYEEIFDNDIYRQHGVTISEGDQIVDVGANTGLFEVFLNHIGVQPTVHAFEPIPAIFETLKRNVEIHSNPNLKIHNCGISSQAGAAAFAFYPRISCASTQFPDACPEEKDRAIEFIYSEMDRLPTPSIAKILRMMFGFTRPWIAERIFQHYYHKVDVECQLRTLPDVMAEYKVNVIDLLKIDAEGAELGIMESLSAEELACVRQAIIEVHTTADVAPITAILRQSGFQVVDDTNPLIPDVHLLYATRTKA